MLQVLVLLLIPGLFESAEGYFQRVIQCEKRHLTINCGFKEIDIRSASYGRTRKGVCVFFGLDSNIYCHSGTSMSVVKHRCQGQRSCTLYATNSAFGDPCVGTEKYLEVQYKCVPRKGLHGTLLQVCEGGKHLIHCHNSKKIRILSANYGRLTGGHICGGRPILTTFCAAAFSLEIVRADCEGRSTCQLEATNSKFGDPCYGTHKYLQVRYKCE